MKEHYEDDHKRILEITSIGGNAPELIFSVIMGDPALKPVKVKELVAMLCTWLAVEAPYLLTPDVRFLASAPESFWFGDDHEPTPLVYGGWSMSCSEIVCPKCFGDDPAGILWVEGDETCGDCGKRASDIGIGYRLQGPEPRLVPQSNAEPGRNMACIVCDQSLTADGVACESLGNDYFICLDCKEKYVPYLGWSKYTAQFKGGALNVAYYCPDCTPDPSATKSDVKIGTECARCSRTAGKEGDQ